MPDENGNGILFYVLNFNGKYKKFNFSKNDFLQLLKKSDLIHENNNKESIFASLLDFIDFGNFIFDREFFNYLFIENDFLFKAHNNNNHKINKHLNLLLDEYHLYLIENKKKNNKEIIEVDFYRLFKKVEKIDFDLFKRLMEYLPNKKIDDYLFELSKQVDYSQVMPFFSSIDNLRNNKDKKINVFIDLLENVNLIKQLDEKKLLKIIDKIDFKNDINSRGRNLLETLISNHQYFPLDQEKIKQLFSKIIKNTDFDYLDKPNVINEILINNNKHHYVNFYLSKILEKNSEIFNDIVDFLINQKKYNLNNFENYLNNYQLNGATAKENKTIKIMMEIINAKLINQKIDQNLNNNHRLKSNKL